MSTKYFSTALSLICLVNSSVRANETPSFVATITPLGADDTVMGTAVAFAEGSKVAFAGLLSGAPANLDATMCDGTSIDVYGCDCCQMMFCWSS